MKKIIKGKVYETEKASLVGSSSDASLYRKRTGEYFMYDGERITPLGYDEAARWAADHLPHDEYQAAFGDAEGGDYERLNLFISSSSVSKVRHAAARKGVSLSAFVEDIFSAL